MLSNNVDRGLVEDQDMATIQLKQGTNELLLKVTQRGGGWAACARIVGSDGRPLKGLRGERGPVAAWSIHQSQHAGRQQFAIYMEARRKSEPAGDFSAMPRGWCVGSEHFRQELLVQMTSVQGSKFAGPEWKETGQKKAERIVTEELERRGWAAEVLSQLRKADPEKLKIADRLRTETTVTLKWITQHLKMGAPGYVSNCLRAAKP